MAKALALSAAVLAAAVAGCSPFGGGAFSCDTDENCRPGGMCQPNHFCSFADPTCVPSGQRYDDHSGANTGVCVGDEPEHPEAGIDTPPDFVCFGTGMVKPCFPTAPAGDLMLPATIDTGTSSLCSSVVTSVDNSTNNYCVIAGATISTESAVSVTGTKPLVLVAALTITIGSTLDAASHRMPTKLGPGADPTGCDAGTVPGTNGGGAGGSLIGRGGGGGGNAAATTGGTSGTVQTVTTLRGGCPGQNGTAGAGGPGAGGHGGGAVYLIADGSITISAAINASGSGGVGGTAGNGAAGGGGGGGGGGSGGMIGLDAPSIMNMAAGVVFANGGSGGEGGSGGNLANGNPGLEPSGAAASGSSGGNTTSGGDGGGGSAGGTAGGTAAGDVGVNGALSPGAGPTGGGGGGGGGAGLLKVFRGTLTGARSPNPS